MLRSVHAWNDFIRFFSVLSNVKDTDTKGIQYHHKDTIKDRII